jgi:hypothetical protein
MEEKTCSLDSFSMGPEDISSQRAFPYSQQMLRRDTLLCSGYPIQEGFSRTSREQLGEQQGTTWGIKGNFRSERLCLSELRNILKASLKNDTSEGKRLVHVAEGNCKK